MALPQKSMLPQKSFHILIAFADYDLPAEISEVVFGAAWFYFGRFVGGAKGVRPK